jgi:probable F420-dependent oxidoreductase
MKFGVGADVTDCGVAVTDFARAVEDAGLESLLVSQRIHVPASRSELLEQELYKTEANLLDPFVALGAAAAVTSRLKLGPAGCFAALYDPIILAKQVATLDQVSSGRVLFGITPGWLEEEVRNHGVNPTLRAQVLREKVLAMKTIWTDAVAEFHGQFVDFAPIRTGLRPWQQPHPPILVGSQGAKGLARTAECGNEWFPVVGADFDLGAQMNELARLCHARGRPTALVTAFLWELDESLIEQCAKAGVNRCVVYFYPERQGVVQSFLDHYTDLARRFRGLN